ncbi:MAG: UDP-N-acetylglucosamine--N-acetylmuramyl-(pentapeptide) pyrophosphoryl-undecaprenol N-acetylglucosamine transferase [bacterium]|nr:UDP-N-acetylglucosamine--N-acetylmuramyl-(pentapeptide) pyrophosphoryl-undecaprenol N-acetylglucosamine transferase [bacterium]MDI1334979.1 UDP-N-acetylglucosamine--N-acetylmuramyl-(pentapeptide) pyrophosphoryl-undecaprenol N-acetylglucosamine transferase [Lacunisphaera sp.]
MSKFLIACGGTGGHLAPGIALAEALHARGHTTTLFISQKKVDARLCEHYPELKVERVPGAPFGWRPDVHLRFHWRQTQGLLFSLKFLRAHRPDAIIGFGGFTNAGVVMAGKLLGVPVALHEANRIPGRAIRVLSRISKRLYLPPGVRLPGRLGLDVRHTGLPVRKEVCRIPRDAARAQLGVDPAQKLLVLFGGSQGSAPLNDWLLAHLEALASEGVQVWCVTGLGKGENGVRELHTKNGTVVRAWFEPFTDRVGTLLSAADLVLGRAGAGTLAELVRCETPAILIPYPHAADNHQAANAAYFEQQGGGLTIDETNLVALRQEILDVIFNDWLLNKFRVNLHRMSQENTIDTIVQDLEDLANRMPPRRHLRHTPAPAAT